MLFLRGLRDPLRQVYLDTEAQRTRMPWMYRNTRGHLFIGGWLVHKCLIVLLVLVSLIWFTIWLIRYAYRDPADNPYTFRSSSVIPRNEFPRTTLSWRHRLISYWEAHSNEVCGVILPYLRVYQQYLIAKLHNIDTDAFNPTYEIDWSQATNVTSVEKSLMCEDQSEKSEIKVERATTIWFEFETLLSPVNQRERHLVTNVTEAACIQHLVDVLQGKWTCNDGGKQLYVPRYWNGDEL